MPITIRVALAAVLIAAPLGGHAVDDRWCIPEMPVKLADTESVSTALVREGEMLTADGFRVTGLLNPVASRADRGRLNYGVYRTPLFRDGKNLVLKVAASQGFTFKSARGEYLEFTGSLWSGGLGHGIDRSSQRFREYLLVHSRLGEMGISPRLHAVFEVGPILGVLFDGTSGMYSLAERGGFDLNEFGASRPIGLLMDEILDARALSRPTPPPEFMATWCEAQVMQALKEIAEIRRRLAAAGIFPEDQQLVVTRDANVWLIDVDAAYFDPVKAATIDFEMEATKLVDDWEAASGRRLRAGVLKKAIKGMSGVPDCVSGPDWRHALAESCENEQEQEQTVTEAKLRKLLAEWPDFRSRYTAITIGEKIVLVAGAYGTYRVVTALLGPLAAKAFSAAALFYAGPANASERADYFLTVDGIDLLMKYENVEDVERILRRFATPELVEFYQGLYDRLPHPAY